MKVEARGPTSRSTILSKDTTQPADRAYDVGQRYPTVFGTPIAPSPMMIIVNKDNRSFMCVSLKLSFRHGRKDDIETNIIYSSGRTIHHRIWMLEIASDLNLCIGLALVSIEMSNWGSEYKQLPDTLVR